MTSIIIPVMNNLDYTKKCIDSIKANTEDYELIIIDNGSDLETKDYLNSLDVTVVTNVTNVGVSKAWNQGIKASKGDYIAILNNDIEVYPNWLSECIKALDTHNLICVSPKSTIGDFDHKNYWDNEFSKTQKDLLNLNSPVISQSTIHGWCFILKAQSIQEMYWKELENEMSPRNEYRIALIDEQFEYAHYEDSDLSVRLEKVGRPCYEVQSALVHHYGSKTLVPNLHWLHPHIESNANKFHKKHRKIDEA